MNRKKQKGRKKETEMNRMKKKKFFTFAMRE